MKTIQRVSLAGMLLVFSLVITSLTFYLAEAGLGSVVTAKDAAPVLVQPCDVNS